ncbi:MAG: caspase family protein, partial [Hyphomicrobiaceae bacterium]
RDNPLARNLARSMGTRSAAIGRGLAAASTGLGTFIAYATQPGNVALDGDGKNSPFTEALARHMRVRNRNLAATMIEVRKDVVAATGGRQVPWDHSALTGEFYFVPPTDNPAAGSVSAAPSGSTTDLAALQERLRVLEEQARSRDAAPLAGAMMTADGIRLAELRARAAGLEDQVKEMQKRLMNARMQEGRAANQDERMRLMRESSALQMDWTRRGLELKKMREEIAALEAQSPAATGGRDAFDIPVAIGGVTPSRSQQGFDFYDGLAVTSGDSVKDVRVDSADGCMVACRHTPECGIAFHRTLSPRKPGQAMADMTQFCAIYRSASTFRPDPDATTIARRSQ